MGTLRGIGVSSVVFLTALSLCLFVAGCGNNKKKNRPTPTPTSIAGTATATRPPTATFTAGGATATPTATSGGATATRTNTVAPPTATNTQAGTPTATRTVSNTPTTTATTTGPGAGRASKSSSIAISNDDAVVVMVNPDDDSISIFETSTNTRTAKVTTGNEPSSVVIAPDNTTAFVANRADGTVVKVSELKSANPVVSEPLIVGSEPTGLALSPTGEDLFVAEFAEGSVLVIEVGTAVTEVGDIEHVIEMPEHPRAVAVTNNGNDEGDDETLIVTDFYGEPNEDVSGCPNGTAEACDTGRIGRVWLFTTDESYSLIDSIVFNPIDSGFAPSTAPPTPTVMTSPNQLYAAAVQGEKVYVTSVSSSPQGPINFQANVFPVVYVGNLDPPGEDTTATANIARLVRNVIPDGGGTDSFFLQEIVDLDFVAGSTAAWLVSRAADVAQQVVYDPDTGVPSASVPQVDLGVNVGAGACQNPTGVVTSATLGKAYVNCWITRRLGVVDLDSMALQTTVQSSDLPPAGTTADNVRLGARFYFTGRVRWSQEGEGYSSCGSCHPDGLSDGITHAFGAGPRQTTSMDGSFSHGVGPQKERLFNWTAINDEVHDFERNTRANSGGLGAITSQTRDPGQPCVLAEETRVNIDAPPANFGQLGVPVKEIQDTTADICVKDWDKIEAFVKTIRPPNALRRLDQDSVARGAALFDEGKCSTCHGDAGWTVSRRFYAPSTANNGALMMADTNPFLPPTADTFWPANAAQISPQPASAEDPPMVVGPNEVACVLRKVDTFGIPDDSSATNAIEVKVDGTRAQGRGGFNVPSLYGLSVGAPYFHHGQAHGLTDVFTELWQPHYQAANPAFELDTPERVEDLVNFLLSIDANTPEKAVPSGFDGCPIVFPPGEVFHADLDGQQEVGPVDTEATGEGVFFLSGDEQLISFQVSVNGLTPDQILFAHIHAPAPAGENAGIVIFLAHHGFTSPLRGQIGPSDFLPNAGGGLDTFSDFLEALRTGNTYANVHSMDHPAGEIRGQIHGPAFTAQLSGNQEVPPVTTTPPASGEALYFSSPDGNSLSFVLNTFLLLPPDILFAHIHAAPVGVNGDVVIILSPTAFSSPLIGRFDQSDIQPNSAGITTFPQLLAAMTAGDTYTNVHNQEHQGGVIRGQNAAE